MRAAGISAPVVMSPLLEIMSTKVTPNFDGIAGVVFTSVNGVEASPAQDLPAWCVGEATAAAATARGWRAIAAGGDAQSLCKRIVADAEAGRFDGLLLHLRGVHARGDVAQTLSAAGVPTDEVVVYDQLQRALSEDAKTLLMREIPVIVPLFSPRSAAQFVTQVAELPVKRAPLFVVAMSAAVAEAAEGLSSEQVLVSEQADAKSMVDAMARLLDAADIIEERGHLT